LSNKGGSEKLNPAGWKKTDRVTLLSSILSHRFSLNASFSILLFKKT